MNLLEWYEILVWRRIGKYFVSNSDYQNVYDITRYGFELVGCMTELAELKAKSDRYAISKLLDEKILEKLPYRDIVKRHK